MVLGEAMARLSEEAPRRWSVATVDHGLRADARKETAFVKAAAKRWGVECDVVRLQPTADMPHGLLAWARGARYAALDKVRLKRKHQWLATAHHAQDQAETLLVRLARGGALRGIPALRGTVVRPLLSLLPSDLAHFAEKHEVRWMEDPSNRDPQHLRARLRAQVMPVFQAAAQTDIVEALAQAALSLHADDDFLNEAAGDLWRDAAGRGELSAATVSLKLIKTAPVPLLRRGFVAWLRAAGVVDVSRASLAALCAGHGVRLPGGREVRRDGKNLRLM